jgi:hypothetical protein
VGSFAMKIASMFVIATVIPFLLCCYYLIIKDIVKTDLDLVYLYIFTVSIFSIILIWLHQPVLSYKTDGDQVEKQLVSAAFRIANCFVSLKVVRGVLERMGFATYIARMKKITVRFIDPAHYFANNPAPYAYSWIDPDMYDQYTVIFDRSILVRYRALYGGGAVAARNEMYLIEFFIAIKLLHELAHLGFRWTYSHLLVHGHTPPRINGGENGQYLERMVFGGAVGFAYRGVVGWDGSQSFDAILIDRHPVVQEHAMAVCAECRKPSVDSVDPFVLLPTEVQGRVYRCTANQHIMSSPSTEATNPADDIDLGPDVHIVSAGPCGTRRLCCRPALLDFSRACN